MRVYKQNYNIRFYLRYSGHSEKTFQGDYKETTGNTYEAEQYRINKIRINKCDVQVYYYFVTGIKEKLVGERRKLKSDKSESQLKDEGLECKMAKVKAIKDNPTSGWPR